MSQTEKSLFPEKIVFVNAATGEVTKEVNFTDVPESIRLLPNAQGELEPVVKITEFTTENQRIIKQLGRDGTVLKSTVQILEN